MLIPFKMQAKEDKDDSNSAEKLLQVEEEAIDKNTAQTYGSGIEIDERGRVRRISIRRRGRCEVQQSAAVDKIAQIFGSGSKIDKRGRVRRISNRVKSSNRARMMIDVLCFMFDV